MNELSLGYDSAMQLGVSDHDPAELLEPGEEQFAVQETFSVELTGAAKAKMDAAAETGEKSAKPAVVDFSKPTEGEKAQMMDALKEFQGKVEADVASREALRKRAIQSLRDQLHAEIRNDTERMADLAKRIKVDAKDTELNQEEFEKRMEYMIVAEADSLLDEHLNLKEETLDRMNALEKAEAGFRRSLDKDIPSSQLRPGETKGYTYMMRLRADAIRQLGLDATVWEVNELMDRLIQKRASTYVIEQDEEEERTIMKRLVDYADRGERTSGEKALAVRGETAVQPVEKKEVIEVTPDMIDYPDGEDSALLSGSTVGEIPALESGSEGIAEADMGLAKDIDAGIQAELATAQAATTSAESPVTEEPALSVESAGLREADPIQVQGVKGAVQSLFGKTWAKIKGRAPVTVGMTAAAATATVIGGVPFAAALSGVATAVGLARVSRVILREGPRGAWEKGKALAANVLKGANESVGDMKNKKVMAAGFVLGGGMGYGVAKTFRLIGVSKLGAMILGTGEMMVEQKVATAIPRVFGKAADFLRARHIDRLAEEASTSGESVDDLVRKAEYMDGTLLGQWCKAMIAGATAGVVARKAQELVTGDYGKEKEEPKSTEAVTVENSESYLPTPMKEGLEELEELEGPALVEVKPSSLEGIIENSNQTVVVESGETFWGETDLLDSLENVNSWTNPSNGVGLGDVLRDQFADLWEAEHPGFRFNTAGPASYNLNDLSERARAAIVAASKTTSVTDYLQNARPLYLEAMAAVGN